MDGLNWVTLPELKSQDGTMKVLGWGCRRAGARMGIEWATGGSQALPPIMHRGREHPAGQDGHRQVLNDILTKSAFPQVGRSQIYINVRFCKFMFL